MFTSRLEGEANLLPMIHMETRRSASEPWVPALDLDKTTFWCEKATDDQVDSRMLSCISALTGYPGLVTNPAFPHRGRPADMEEHPDVFTEGWPVESQTRLDRDAAAKDSSCADLFVSPDRLAVYLGAYDGTGENPDLMTHFTMAEFLEASEKPYYQAAELHLRLEDWLAWEQRGFDPEHSPDLVDLSLFDTSNPKLSLVQGASSEEDEEEEEEVEVSAPVGIEETGEDPSVAAPKRIKAVVLSEVQAKLMSVFDLNKDGSAVSLVRCNRPSRLPDAGFQFVKGWMERATGNRLDVFRAGPENTRFIVGFSGG